MKRRSDKSQNSFKSTNKPPKQEPEDLQDDIDDSSLDEIFRFDDKLIGKRTNTIFDVKPANDGFFDIIQENFNSELSFESSSGEYDYSSSVFDNTNISQMEEKKNQKMIRYIKETQGKDILDASLSQIDEDDDVTQENASQNEKVSKQKPVKQEEKPIKKQKGKPQKAEVKALQLQKKPEKAQVKAPQPQKKLDKVQRVQNPQVKTEKPEKHEKNQKELKRHQVIPEKSLERKNQKYNGRKSENQVVKGKVTSNLAKVDITAQKNDKNADQKGQPTAEKKSHIITGEQIPDLEKLNQAKSKARSEDNPKQANQKVESSNQDFVKVEKKFENKNQIQEKRKEEKNKDLSRIPQVQGQAKKQKPKEEKKTLTERIVEASKKIRQDDIERRKRNRSPTPEAFRLPSTKNQRRGIIPKRSSKEKDEQKKIPKFKVGLEIVRPGKNEEYEPFGRMGEEGRYPKRLRVPPLRFWNNERRHYDRGVLSSITLIDDARGRQVSELIERQVNEADDVEI